MKQRQEGRCQCGGWLVIEKDPDVEGFRSMHSVPECEPYKTLCARPGVRCEGYSVCSIPGDSDA